MLAFNLAVAFVNAFLLLYGARAMPWIEPGPTPAGLIQLEGISPRPTEAPGSNGLPHELLKRAIIFPPPANYCGFISGIYSESLTCYNTALTCATYGAAVGCCSNLKDPCTNLHTSCVDFAGSCDKSCLADPQVLYCSQILAPFCQTFRFPSKYVNINCVSTLGTVTGVSWLNDVYATLTGTTVKAATPNVIYAFTGSIASASASASTSSSRASTSSTTSAPTVTSASASTPASTSSSRASTSPTTSTPTVTSASASTPASTSSSSHASTSSTISNSSPIPAKSSLPTGTPSPVAQSGIGVGAIAGIAVGVCGTLALIAGIFIFLCVQKRNRNRAAAETQPRPPAAFDNNLPMQQSHTGQGYQESHSRPSNPAFLGQSPQSPSPPYTSTHTSTLDGQSPAYHSPLLYNDPKSPTGPNKDTLTPHSIVSETDIKRMNTPDYHHQPVSPTITELNGYSTGATAPVDHAPSPVHEVSADPLYHSSRAQSQSQSHTAHNLIHEVSTSQVHTTNSHSRGNVHEVSADPEQRYNAYHPDFAAQSPVSDGHIYNPAGTKVQNQGTGATGGQVGP